MISLRRLLKEKDTVVGATAMEWLRPSLAKLYKHAGFDFVYVEYEHCLLNPETLNNFVISARDSGLPVVAKTPDLYRHLISKILETGVSGIQLPRTNSPLDISKLVDFSKYPPLGTRACATGMASTGYVQLPAEEHMKGANAEVVIVAHVETREGLENIETIVAQPGIDICYVGTFDLAIELGTPGDMNSSIVLQALDRICVACQKHNVIVGTNGSDPETIRLLRKKGIRFFEGPSEFDLLMKGSRGFLSDLQRQRD